MPGRANLLLSHPAPASQHVCLSHLHGEGLLYTGISSTHCASSHKAQLLPPQESPIAALGTGEEGPSQAGQDPWESFPLGPSLGLLCKYPQACAQAWLEALPLHRRSHHTSVMSH